ncbi:hypothetical protein [Paenibacillus silviterrae]|uniref:hypothetical protein n=1 Tax=Paenibacillus silviterrae TaxID=3242194 RepID=UPI0025433FE2|nr:hypothetical protein [Paenibacillus chinjuensis]
MKVIFWLAVIGLGIAFTVSSLSSAKDPMPVQAVTPKLEAPPNPPTRSRTTDGLHEIKNKITEHSEELKERHSVQIQMAGVGEDHIMVHIRRIGDIEGNVSEEELALINKTLFDIAGKEFPLKLSVMKCCKGEPQVTGTIKMFDQEHRRILVVNEQKKNGNTDDPEASWVALQPDGKLIVAGIPIQTGFSKELIGKEAKVWTTGLKLSSYPGQTSALKVVVE